MKLNSEVLVDDFRFQEMSSKDEKTLYVWEDEYRS